MNIEKAREDLALDIWEDLMTDVRESVSKGDPCQLHRDLVELVKHADRVAAAARLLVNPEFTEPHPEGWAALESEIFS